MNVPLPRRRMGPVLAVVGASVAVAATGVAVEAIMDSVSVKTTFSEVLKSKGILFCSISEAVKLYVITSYSIHYTKLYDARIRAAWPSKA